MSYRVWLLPGEWKHADTTLADHKDVTALVKHLHYRVPLVVYFRDAALALELTRMLFEQGAGPAVLRYVKAYTDGGVDTVTCGMFCPPLNEIEKWLKEIETNA